MFLLGAVQGDKFWCTRCYFETACVAELGNALLTAGLTGVKPERVWSMYYLANAVDLKKEKHSKANLNLFF